jgi:hypothetical protein
MFALCGNGRKLVDGLSDGRIISGPSGGVYLLANYDLFRQARTHPGRFGNYGKTPTRSIVTQNSGRDGGSLMLMQTVGEYQE